MVVNIGSGNGLVPDGTKPLPDPMLTYHQLISYEASSCQILTLYHKNVLEN